MIKFILPAVFLLSGCPANFSIPATSADSPPPVSSTPANEVVSRPQLHKRPDGSFTIPTLYWATPQGVAGNGWEAVFGGTVVEVENVAEKKSDGFPFPRKYVQGAIKVEKIFRNLPDSTEITVGSVIRSEDFDGLKKGDKVVFFIDDIYEGGYVRVETAGTNSKLGFKVEDWNEPLVAALEKLAPCDKLRIERVEGHPEDFKARLHDCDGDRESKILDDPEIADIWKLRDPVGYQSLVEMRELRELDK
ncbi:MAG TPA: hypothetical protein VIL74_06090 [Pyrinomonadaceae bacterium]